MPQEVFEGLGDEITQNEWFNQNIKPHVKRAFRFAASDGLTMYVLEIENEERGEQYFMITKTTGGGYMKSIMKLRKRDLRLLKEVIESLLA